MKVNQIYQLVNGIMQEELGDSALIQEDLSNIVAVGEAIANAQAFDKFTNKLVDRIGRMIFVDRQYQARLPKIIRDGWEYGSILCKVDGDLPVTEANEEWSLIDGSTVDPNQVYVADIRAKYYNMHVTFEIPVTIVTDQLKSAFTSANEMNRFISMIFGLVSKAFNKALDSLTTRALINAMAVVGHTDNPARVVHLLTDYTADTGDATITTAEQALSSETFLRYASSRILEKKRDIAELSTLFNEEGRPRQTTDEYLHLVLHAKFASRCDTYLKSQTFHDELVKIPGFETVAKWQGFGTSDSWADTSKIYVTAKKADGTTESVTLDDICAFMFDRDAVAVLQPKEKVTSQYNGKGDFTNYWYKYTGEYINAFDENMVLFLID